MKNIPLTRGLFAKVDDGDFERLSSMKWCASGKRGLLYAQTRINGKLVYMHSMVSGFEFTDHVDLNTLNNTRSNLRQSNKSLNSANTRLKSSNTSGYKGVFWDKKNERWVSMITVNYKSIWLGRFDLKEDAAMAYDRAARKYFGPFALTNAMMR